MKAIKKEITLEFSENEALVLLNFLKNWKESKIKDPHVIDDSEEIVLWNLQAGLERKIANIFSRSYTDDVLKARKI